MYSKQEGAFLRKQFWISFGQYLAPIPSADGNKINWINYKTGIKFISFKMNVLKDQACIGIEVSHKDLGAQKSFFHHFRTLKKEIEQEGGWIWEEGKYVDGKSISRIYQTLDDMNIYDQATWPRIISFLKDRMIFLDRFWASHKDIFEMLG